MVRNRRFKRLAVLAVLSVGLSSVSASVVAADRPDKAPTQGRFKLEEATIEQIHSAFESGELTCQELVGQYLRRVEAYDERGPKINSLIATNPDATSVAAKLDEQYARSGTTGPLHCIPVILKDNYDTKDMPTTGGSLALKDSVPSDDAFLVKKLRKSGALMLAKANMGEFAHGGTPGGSSSSLGGQTVNPYNLDRGPDDSSGGTGASIAANLGTVGTGTDTLGSILGPSAANGIVGIKPTMGLTGRSGIIPFALTFDVAGPMARTVEDAARTLGAMTGVDPRDPVTRRAKGKSRKDYTEFLKTNQFEGARIGVARDFFGGHKEVDAHVNTAIEKMEAQGATIIDPVNISAETLSLEDELYSIISDVEFKTYLNDYLSERTPNPPVRSLAELLTVIEENDHPVNPNVLDRFKLADDRGTLRSPYYRATLRTGLKIYRNEIAKMMQRHDLDALVSPTNPCPADPLPSPDDPSEPKDDPTYECDDTVPSSKGLDNFTGYPQVSVPAGFTSNGLPVNISLLGEPFSEPSLIGLAYSYEQATRHREPPTSTPRLER